MRGTHFQDIEGMANNQWAYSKQFQKATEKSALRAEKNECTGALLRQGLTLKDFLILIFVNKHFLVIVREFL